MVTRIKSKNISFLVYHSHPCLSILSPWIVFSMFCRKCVSVRALFRQGLRFNTPGRGGFFHFAGAGSLCECMCVRECVVVVSTCLVETILGMCCQVWFVS